MLPHESPVHYGLHPNAEIEFLTVTSDNLFHTLLELQSPDAVMGEGASQTLEEKVATQTFSRFLTKYILLMPTNERFVFLDVTLNRTHLYTYGSSPSSTFTDGSHHPPAGENDFR